jgi:acyl-CoA dehydrogenase
MGGDLKRKELLSARLGDILSYLYLTSMVLKHYRDQGNPQDDLPLVEWSCRTLLYRAQEQFHGLLRNFPNRWFARLLRFLIFPRGRTYFSPSDELCQEVAALIINPTDTRARLSYGIYKTAEPNNPIGLLQEAIELAEKVEPLERKVVEAYKVGQIDSSDASDQVDEAERRGIVTAEEAIQIREFDQKIMDLIAVDDFSSEDLARKTVRSSSKKTTKKPLARKKNQ